MKLKKILIIIICILIVGIFLTMFMGEKNNFEMTEDKYGTDVTYLDEAHNIPVASIIDYDISHAKKENYIIKTTSEGKLQLSLDAKINEGKVYIRIKDKENVVEKIDINKNEKKQVIWSLKPNYEYVLEVYIKEGKGVINLDWSEE